MDGGLERPLHMSRLCLCERNVHQNPGSIDCCVNPCGGMHRAGPVATLELPDGDGLHRVYPVCLINNPARRADRSIDVIRSRLQFNNIQ